MLDIYFANEQKMLAFIKKYDTIRKQFELSSAGNKWYISKKDMVNVVSFLFFVPAATPL